MAETDRGYGEKRRKIQEKKSKPNLVPLASGKVVTHCSKLGKCHSDIHLECQKGGVCQIIHYLEGPQEKKGQNIKLVC